MLTNISELTERSIFHALRKVVVDEGYLPDIENYDIENPNLTIAKAAQDEFIQDIEAIVSNRGFAIEVFGYSSNQSRGTKKTPRIVVEVEAFYPGNLGLDTTNQYKYDEINDTYITQKGPSIVSDQIINIHLVGYSTQQHRVLHAVMVKALPRRGYMKWYTEPQLKKHENLFIRYIGYNELNFPEIGVTEKIYRYELPDLHENLLEELYTVPPIKTINLDIMGIEEIVAPDTFPLDFDKRDFK